MVSLKSIRETHPKISNRFIHQLVNPRNWKRILGAYVVQIREINANVPFPVLLPYHHSIGQPFRIEGFLDCPRLLQFVDLFSDGFGMLF